MVNVDKRAASLWINAHKSLENYKAYISNKVDKFQLSYIDLLYVSNFKGGNSSIHENESLANKKLHIYSQHLKEISSQFSGKTLLSLKDAEVENLVARAELFVSLTLTEETKIYGFKVSYASALLHAYFPEMVPILDRRILINLGIAKANPSTNQIDYIEQYLSPLIRRFRDELEGGRTLRELDQHFFQLAITKPTQKENGR